jgi:hypothetical protein
MRTRHLFKSLSARSLRLAGNARKFMKLAPTKLGFDTPTRGKGISFLSLPTDQK